MHRIIAAATIAALAACSTPASEPAAVQPPAADPASSPTEPESLDGNWDATPDIPEAQPLTHVDVSEPYYEGASRAAVEIAASFLGMAAPPVTLDAAGVDDIFARAEAPAAGLLALLGSDFRDDHLEQKLRTLTGDQDANVVELLARTDAILGDLPSLLAHYGVAVPDRLAEIGRAIEQAAEAAGVDLAVDLTALQWLRHLANDRPDVATVFNDRPYMLREHYAGTIDGKIYRADVVWAHPSHHSFEAATHPSGKRARVATTAAAHGMMAAVNAGFWTSGVNPDSLFVHDGRLATDTAAWQGQHRSIRPAVLVTGSDVRVETPVMSIHAVDSDGGIYQVRTVNDTPLENDLVVRTGDDLWSRWPANADVYPLESSALTVSQDLAVIEGTPAALDGADVQLYATGAIAAKLRSVELDHVQVRWDTTSQMQFAVSGGPTLLAGGQPTSPHSWITEGFGPAHTNPRHPRTFVGVTAEGIVAIGTIDGRRSKWSLGMSQSHVQQFAASLGLVDAMMFDGGGSATLVVDGVVINRYCCDSRPRAVGTIFGFRPAA